MTMCELARLYKNEVTPKLNLKTICCTGWKRRWGWHFDHRWFPPSPNMPTVDTARVYPGGCLYEGTNLSEGRGTTRPFEYVGHPNINPSQLAIKLKEFDLPGVTFIAASFQPTFQKHAGQSCGGVFIVPTNLNKFQPLRVGLAVIMACRELLGEKFCWRTERYEFVDHIPAIDLLFGSDRERKAIEAGDSFKQIVEAWQPEQQEFAERKKSAILYTD
jgi:uncharacterized protein YbbC (DUF1343 family)